LKHYGKWKRFAIPEENDMHKKLPRGITPGNQANGKKPGIR